MAEYEILIVGGGPAGYTAALYAAHSGRKTAVVEKLSPGGQMATTSTTRHWPRPEWRSCGTAVSQHCARKNT